MGFPNKAAYYLFISIFLHRLVLIFWFIQTLKPGEALWWQMLQTLRHAIRHRLEEMAVLQLTKALFRSIQSTLTIIRLVHSLHIYLTTELCLDDWPFAVTTINLLKSLLWQLWYWCKFNICVWNACWQPQLTTSCFHWTLFVIRQ